MNRYDLLNIFNLKICDNIDIYKISSLDKIDMVDNEGYFYNLNFSNLSNRNAKSGSLARFFNNNPHTFKNMQTFIGKHYGDHIKIVDISNVNTAKDDICLLCEKHNVKYYKCWNVIKNGQYCNECGMEKYKEHRKHDIEHIKIVADNKYGITIVSDEYVNNITPLKFTCHKHESMGVQERSWANIISATHSCVYCAKESRVDFFSISNEEYTNMASNSNNKVELAGEYTGCKNHILVRCKKCGELIQIRADHILSGVGCSKCYNSNGEVKIKEVLGKYGIKYISQYKFGDCIRNKRDMAFDFYIPNNNTAIEFDGIQHFEPVDLFGGEKQFATQKRNDSFKTQYCKDNNINLIRIPYWEFDSIEEILNKELVGYYDL